MSRFVGRADALGVLAAQVSAPRRLPGFILVSGEAGIGKTALLAHFADRAAAGGAQVVWGACWDADQVPAFWPWTQILRAVAEPSPDLAVIVPEWGPAPALSRLLVFDAVAQSLRQAGSLVVIIDDLQWADASTLELLRFLAGQAFSGPLLLVGAHRPAFGLAELAKLAQPLALTGLSELEIGELVGVDLAPVIYQRSGGHPFFARELGHVIASGGDIAGVPVAVREVISRRVAGVSSQCGRMLEVASVAGPSLSPGVLAAVTGSDPDGLLREAREAGLLTGMGFVHDLYRESIYEALSAGQRLDLHHRIGLELLHSRSRGGEVFPAELARHFAASASLAGAELVLEWARAAASAESARFAYTEAAGHLARARQALAAIASADRSAASSPALDPDGPASGSTSASTSGSILGSTSASAPGLTSASASGSTLASPQAESVVSALADLMVEESAARMRAGDALTARELLDLAWQLVREYGDPARMGAVALGYDALGARFAMPRAALVSTLDSALDAMAGTSATLEAQLAAALARQLQHSVPRDRHRAAPLAQRAVAIARVAGDPATLATSLLAQHDTLWTAGTAVSRSEIATEIAVLALRSGDQERYAQGLLLTASAQLELGSPAFRATYAEYAQVTAELRQPRHDYLLRTRQAALALLDGDIDEGERLCLEATRLGETVGDSDAGNVRMSQLLEVARARGEADMLRRIASDAIGWWVGAPAHAHAVAAGFLARAGDLPAARRELDILLALPDWKTDRSYLWSVFVGELVTAAIALDDRPLCTQLLRDLSPLAETCAVNGALVCFMGAHAHRIGLLHAALGSPGLARHWLGRGRDIHRALGAVAWEAASAHALSTLDSDTPILRREGDLWLATYQGGMAHVRDSKGMRDLHQLLSRPGTDIPAVDLAGAATHDGAVNDPMVDRRALAAYRRRLSELDDQQTSGAAAERDLLLAELRRSTRPGGATRPLGITTAERARKAVTARIRDAIHRISEVLPDLGTHLDRTIRTGTTCSYEPRDQ